MSTGASVLAMLLVIVSAFLILGWVVNEMADIRLENEDLRIELQEYRSRFARCSADLADAKTAAEGTATRLVTCERRVDDLETQSAARSREIGRLMLALASERAHTAIAGATRSILDEPIAVGLAVLLSTGLAFGVVGRRLAA